VACWETTPTNDGERVAVAIVSVIGGIPLYGLFLYATDHRWVLLWFTLFNLWATWPPRVCFATIVCRTHKGRLHVDRVGKGLRGRESSGIQSVWSVLFVLGDLC
jgi:hypothetical protein